MKILRLVSILLVLITPALAKSQQQRYSYCVRVGNEYSGPRVGYFSEVFPVPDSMRTSSGADPGTLAFKELGPLFQGAIHPRENYGVYLECLAFDTMSEALRYKRFSQSQFSGSRTVIETHWLYSPMRHGTYTSLAKPTEADALFDAETHMLAFAPFENNKGA
jgi:hypothetical protein